MAGTPFRMFKEKTAKSKIAVRNSLEVEEIYRRARSLP
jgi:hypothetical protein